MQLVLLHALPLDGTMWANEMQLLPNATIAPSLYSFGESIEDWAQAVLELTSEETFVVVGNSVGGSCALEVARRAPARVKAIVLIGAKAGVRPDPVFRDEAVRILNKRGMEEAWLKYWADLFGANADPEVVEAARLLACSLHIGDVVLGSRHFTTGTTLRISLDPGQSPLSSSAANRMGRLRTVCPRHRFVSTWRDSRHQRCRSLRVARTAVEGSSHHPRCPGEAGGARP